MSSDTRGIQLTVRIDAAPRAKNRKRWTPSIEIDLAYAIDRCAPELLFRPSIDRGRTAEHFDIGDAELVVELWDRKRNVLGEFAWPASEQSYVDYGTPTNSRFLVVPLPAAEDIREICVPLVDGTSCLTLWLSEVVEREGAPRSANRVMMGLYPLRAQDVAFWRRALPAGPVHELPAPWPGLDTRVYAPAVGLKGGAILHDQIRHRPSDHPQSLDIVISGDGYQEPGDLKAFGARANELIEGLLAIPPFDRLSDLISWHVVPVRSDYGRIPTNRRGYPTTFFGLVCHDAGPDTVSIDRPIAGRVNKVRMAAGAPRGLVILIANTPEWGGHGWFAQRTAVVALANTYRYLFPKLAAHESGHALIDLAEERVSGVSKEYQPHRHPNMATLNLVAASVKDHLDQYHATSGSSLSEQLSSWHAHADTIWWRGLTLCSSKNQKGHFNAVHDPGDLWDYGGANWTLDADCDYSSTFPAKVGAFWGCQNVDVKGTATRKIAQVIGRKTGALMEELLLDNNCHDPWQPRGSGAFYYRPAANCCMRLVPEDFDTGHPFCPVCEHAIANAILGASGQTPNPPFWNP